MRLGTKQHVGARAGDDPQPALVADAPCRHGNRGWPATKHKDPAPNEKTNETARNRPDEGDGRANARSGNAGPPGRLTQARMLGYARARRQQDKALGDFGRWAFLDVDAMVDADDGVFDVGLLRIHCRRKTTRSRRTERGRRDGGGAGGAARTRYRPSGSIFRRAASEPGNPKSYATTMKSTAASASEDDLDDSSEMIVVSRSWRRRPRGQRSATLGIGKQVATARVATNLDLLDEGNGGEALGRLLGDLVVLDLGAYPNHGGCISSATQQPTTIQQPSIVGLLTSPSPSDPMSIEAPSCTADKRRGQISAPPDHRASISSESHENLANEREEVDQELPNLKLGERFLHGAEALFEDSMLVLEQLGHETRTERVVLQQHSQELHGRLADLRRLIQQALAGGRRDLRRCPAAQSNHAQFAKTLQRSSRLGGRSIRTRGRYGGQTRTMEATSNGRWRKRRIENRQKNDGDDVRHLGHDVHWDLVGLAKRLPRGDDGGATVRRDVEQPGATATTQVRDQRQTALMGIDRM